MIKTLKKNIFIDIKKNNQKKIIFVILQDNEQTKVFRIDAGADKQAIRNYFDNTFESIMRGEKSKYREITHRRNYDFLLFGIGDREKFESYVFLDRDKSQQFNHIEVYPIGKKIKQIDKKAQKAMEALRQLLYAKNFQINYNDLDVFLISTPSFKYLANNTSQKEQNSLKRTIIHGMIEKIYDNMIEKRGSSYLRFALVLLKKDLRTLDKNIISHLFYDIKNGVNLNREILKQQPPLVADTITPIYNEEPCNIVDIFIQREEEKRFILLFLNTLLSMQTNPFWDIKKVLVLVSYICYILSTEDVKVTHRAGIEKIKIDYSYMVLVQLLSQIKASYFILLLQSFLKDKDGISIELFLQQDIEYHCFENKKEKSITVKAFDKILTIQQTTLRQNSSRFFKNILIIGQFYRVVSQENKMDLVIASFLKKITDRDMNINRYCQEPIIPKFLTLFLTGYNRKECKIALRDFFDTFKCYL